MFVINILRESVIKPQEKAYDPIFFHGILSSNIIMKKLFENIRKAAQTDVSIYISGETGVGKELVARAIHAETTLSVNPSPKRLKLNRDIITNSLIKHCNNRNKTAEFLGISRMTLWRKMKTFGLL